MKTFKEDINMNTLKGDTKRRHYKDTLKGHQKDIKRIR